MKKENTLIGLEISVPYGLLPYGLFQMGITNTGETLEGWARYAANLPDYEVANLINSALSTMGCRSEAVCDKRQDVYPDDYIKNIACMGFSVKLNSHS